MSDFDLRTFTSKAEAALERARAGRIGLDAQLDLAKRKLKPEVFKQEARELQEGHAKAVRGTALELLAAAQDNLPRIRQSWSPASIRERAVAKADPNALLVAQNRLRRLGLDGIDAFARSVVKRGDLAAAQLAIEEAEYRGRELGDADTQAQAHIDGIRETVDSADLGEQAERYAERLKSAAIAAYRLEAELRRAESRPFAALEDDVRDLDLDDYRALRHAGLSSVVGSPWDGHPDDALRIGTHDRGDPPPSKPTEPVGPRIVRIDSRPDGASFRVEAPPPDAA